jgi:hypothetical protein
MTTRRSVSTFIFIACGTWLIALGLYFMMPRAPLLHEDARYIGISLPFYTRALAPAAT